MSAKITISVPDDFKEQMMKKAEEEQRSLSSLVRIAVQEYLDKELCQK